MNPSPHYERKVVFTDLDGTLLDHDTYSFLPALPAIRKLDQLGVPVIPVTSKTRIEVEELRVALGLNSPFVVENGAAIYIPKDDNILVSSAADVFDDEFGKNALEESDHDGGFYCKSFSPKRVFWQEIIEQLKRSFPSSFKTFSELGVSGIADATGLSKLQAHAANQREFSEPVLWLANETELTEFVSEIEKLGYVALLGGRFVHITNGYDKGQALSWLMDAYRKKERESKWSSIALGDSGNDIAMLEAADQAVWVKSPVKTSPQSDSLKDAYYSESYGPSGWAEAIEKFI